MDLISINSKYADVYNMAGLILMYKGEFNQAFKIFSINCRLNNDKKSGEYIEKLDYINGCIVKYNEAIDKIEKEKFKEAKDILESLQLQGFTIQNGCILLCLLYYREKDYKRCCRMLDMIIQMDKGCSFYYDMKNKLEEIKGKRIKKALYVSAAGFILTTSISVYQWAMFIRKPVETIKYIPQIKEVLVETNREDNNLKILVSLQKYIIEGNFYGYAKNRLKLDVNKLDNEAKEVYKSFEDKYNRESKAYFYREGLKLYKDKDYQKSLEYFKIAIENNVLSHFDEHILFFMAKDAAKLGKKEAEEYYKHYIDTYKEGTYRPEAIYDLTLFLYENKNMDEAQKYAGMIAKEYKGSIYNNSRIKKIMGP